MNEIKIYENNEIRSIWDNKKEEWYFSVVDVVGVLTEQETPRGASTYWAVLKKRLKEEGNELLTICKQLKMKATDGKMRILMLQICKAFSVSFSRFHRLKQRHLKCGWQKWEKKETMRLSILNLLSTELCNL